MAKSSSYMKIYRSRKKSGTYKDERFSFNQSRETYSNTEREGAITWNLESKRYVDLDGKSYPVYTRSAGSARIDLGDGYIVNAQKYYGGYSATVYHNGYALGSSVASEGGTGGYQTVKDFTSLKEINEIVSTYKTLQKNPLKYEKVADLKTANRDDVVGRAGDYVFKRSYNKTEIDVYYKGKRLLRDELFDEGNKWRHPKSQKQALLVAEIDRMERTLEKNRKK